MIDNKTAIEKAAEIVADLEAWDILPGGNVSKAARSRINVVLQRDSEAKCPTCGDLGHHPDGTTCDDCVVNESAKAIKTLARLTPEQRAALKCLERTTSATGSGFAWTTYVSVGMKMMPRANVHEVLNSLHVLGLADFKENGAKRWWITKTGQKVVEAM